MLRVMGEEGEFVCGFRPVTLRWLFGVQRKGEEKGHGMSLLGVLHLFTDHPRQISLSPGNSRLRTNPLSWALQLHDIVLHENLTRPPLNLSIMSFILNSTAKIFYYFQFHSTAFKTPSDQIHTVYKSHNPQIRQVLLKQMSPNFTRWNCFLKIHLFPSVPKTLMPAALIVAFIL